MSDRAEAERVARELCPRAHNEAGLAMFTDEDGASHAVPCDMCEENAATVLTYGNDQREAERARMQEWVDDLQSGMYINCVYCGHRYGPADEVPSTMADVLKEHIERCPDHPMSKLREALLEAEEDRDEERRLRLCAENDMHNMETQIEELTDALP